MDNPGQNVTVPPPPKPYLIQKAYEPTMIGLEKAKRDVRIMMGRIVNEVSERVSIDYLGANFLAG